MCRGLARGPSLVPSVCLSVRFACCPFCRLSSRLHTLLSTAIVERFKGLRPTDQGSHAFTTTCTMSAAIYGFGRGQETTVQFCVVLKNTLIEWVYFGFLSSLLFCFLGIHALFKCKLEDRLMYGCAMWEHSGEPFNIISINGESFANVKEMCCTAVDWLSDPSDLFPKMQKNWECPFIVASLRHNFAIFKLSNQHPAMPHLCSGMDYLSKGVLTFTKIT